MTDHPSQSGLTNTRLAAGQRRALELIATGAPLKEVLDHIVEMVEEQAPGMRGSVLVIPDGLHLRHASAPRLPAAYTAAIEGYPIGPTAGSCGTAMWHDHRVIVSDIATDPLWEGYRELTLPFGLRACWSTPIHSRTGEVIGSFAMYYDEPREPTTGELELADLASLLAAIVIEHEQAVAKLRDSEKRYRGFVETANEGVWMTDPDGITTFANRRVAELLGHPMEDIVGVSCLKFMDEPTQRLAVQEYAQRRKGLAGRHDACLIRADGTRVWVLVSASPVFDDDGAFAGGLAMITDITDRVAAERQLRHLALHDQVTSLPNRAVITSVVEHALATQRRGGGLLAVLLVDLDGFKRINDTLGHQIGDELLCSFAARLRDAVRASDTVARLSGDEFVVVADVLEHDLDVVAIAQRVQSALDEPFELADGRHSLSASIGIALARDGDGSVEALLRDADAAMYRAKQAGGGRHELFDEAMRRRAAARRQVVQALGGAIANAELQVLYQPIVSLRTHQPVAVEALLRWENPDVGPIGPGRFIPIAEECGLIGDIGAWVLFQSCEQARRWSANGAGPAGLSVNLSARQLTERRLVQDVELILRTSGLPPEQLWLEVTESAVLTSLEQATAVLGQLRRLGVRIVLDDFGTGYSSLRYVLELPIDTIKIDRSFALALDTASPAREIISAVTDMGHALGKQVVAEGIETERQLEVVRELGCDLAQGYLFSRPVPPELLSGAFSTALGPRPPSAG